MSAQFLPLRAFSQLHNFAGAASLNGGIRNPSDGPNMLSNTRIIVAERGMAGVTIRNLAPRSGVTPPTIYNLLGGRGDVLRQAVLEALARKLKLDSDAAPRIWLSQVSIGASKLLVGGKLGQRKSHYE